MPRKFTVEVTFDLSSEVEPDLDSYQFDPNDDRVTEYEDSSYFGRASVDASGGSITFTVEAEDEDEAEQITHETISDGMEVDDREGLTWLVENVRVEVEEVIVPMDLTRATELVTAFVTASPFIEGELEEAFGFLLEVVNLQSRDMALQRDEILRLQTELARIAGELDRQANGPDGSEVIAV